MNWKWLWEVGDRTFQLRAEAAEREPGPLEYPISERTWKRAIRLMRHFGSQRALELIDERAWRAFHRGDDETSRRWRDLIIAIHAMEEDEPIPGERTQ